jgi:uncharacterized protein (DUF433 family)
MAGETAANGAGAAAAVRLPGPARARDKLAAWPARRRSTSASSSNPRRACTGGRPCLAGTRFPILQVAAEFEAGMTAEELIANYGLDPAAACAGIAYYLANKAAVDAELAEREREGAEALAQWQAERARATV